MKSEDIKPADSTLDESAANESMDVSTTEAVEPETAKARPPPRALTGIRGEVTRSRRFGVCVSFQLEGKAQTAGLLPGRAYVNGTSHLLESCKSDQELALVFPKGLEVNFDCTECDKPNRFQHFKGNQKGKKNNEAAAADGKADEEGNGENKFDTLGWRITQLWITESPSDQPSDAQKQSFTKRLEWVNQNSLKEEKPESDIASDTWFVRVAPVWPLPHPDKASNKSATGVVSKLLLPQGGIVKVGGVEVFFHRARVFLDTEHLSATADLAEAFPLGTQVEVDYSPLEELTAGSRTLERHCPEGVKHVALLVFTESRPTLSDLIFNQKQLNFKEGTNGYNVRQPYYMARMISFDPAGASGVESGVAELINPSAHTQVRPVLKRLIANGKDAAGVKRVRFNRRNLFHLGASLENADLQYFFSPALYGMDLFYCYLRPLDESERNTLSVEHANVTHEVSLGWKSTMSYQHSTGSGLHVSTANNAENTLLYPSVYSFNSVKLFSREGLDVSTYEGILEGSVAPRKDYFNGVENVPEKEKVALARVEDLFPPFIKQTQVHTGLLHVETGEHSGLSAFFYRKELSVFGFSLENADLQLFLSQNDPVYVKLAPAEKGTKVKASEAWIGWPRDPANPQTLENMPANHRYKFFLWLESHNMTIASFMKALKGEGPERQFIPFRREENKGTVVFLKRSEHKYKGKCMGAVGGIIKVESGPLTGELVTFVRKFTWVLGYNLKDADLTHIFIEGQKVSLEAIKISDEQKNKDKKEEYLGTAINYRATMVWTSKFIPRSDIHKTVGESNHVNGWLKKRGLTFENFKTLVKGELAPVDKTTATKNKSNMLKGDGSPESKDTTQAATAKDSKTEDNSKLPVFKHGPEAVRMCDIALSVQGPNDPKVNKIIKNDDHAQMAFHLHKTLGLALERYRGGNGPAAPPMKSPAMANAGQKRKMQGQQQQNRNQPQQNRNQPQQNRNQQQQNRNQQQQNRNQPKIQLPQAPPISGNPWAANNASAWGSGFMQQQQQQPMMNMWSNGQQQNGNSLMGAMPQQQGFNNMQQMNNTGNNGGYFQPNQQMQQRKPMMHQQQFNQGNNGGGARPLKRGAPGKARPFPQAKKPRGNYTKY